MHTPNACALKYVNKFRITNARGRVEFGFLFFQTASYRKCS